MRVRAACIRCFAGEVQWGSSQPSCCDLRCWPDMRIGLAAGAGLYGKRRARSLPTIRGDYTKESSSFGLGWLDKTTRQV